MTLSDIPAQNVLVKRNAVAAGRISKVNINNMPIVIVVSVTAMLTNIRKRVEINFSETPLASASSGSSVENNKGRPISAMPTRLTTENRPKVFNSAVEMVKTSPNKIDIACSAKLL